MTGAVTGLVAGVLALAPVALARAQPRDGHAGAEAPRPTAPAGTVVIVAPRCAHVPLDLAAFVAIFRVEVRAFPYEVATATTRDGAARSDGPAAVVALETTPCAPSATTVEATVEARTAAAPGGALAGRRARQQVDLGDVELAARPRVLALAVAELLRPRADASPATSPARTPAPPGHRDAAATTPTTTTATAATTLRLAADARAYSRFSTPLVGGRIGAGRRAGRLPAAVTIDVMFLAGASHLALGSVDLRAIVAAAALDWVPVSGRAVLAIGPRLEAGRGWIVGRAGGPAVSAGRSAGLLAGAALGASLAVRARGALELLVELEAGLTLAEVVGLADGQRAAGFSGAWTGARLGAQMGF